MQPGGEELIGNPVAPALPARHPAVVELDHRTEPVGGAPGKLRHSLRQEGGVPGDIAFGDREAQVIPAAPTARHGGETAGAGRVTRRGERLTQGSGAVLAIKKKDGIGDQTGLWRHLQPQLLGESTALLRFREGRAVLLGDKRRDVGGERIAGVLIAVVVPAEDGREAAGPQHLRDEHRLAVADRGGPPRRGGWLAVALGDRLIERVDPGVIPGLVAIDQRAGAPRLIAHLQGGTAPVDEDGAPAVEGQGRLTRIVELALDHDAALVWDHAGGRQRRASLPVQGNGFGMRQRGARAGEPLAIQLHRAGGTPNHGAVTRHDGKGAGHLVGERR